MLHISNACGLASRVNVLELQLKLCNGTLNFVILI